MGATIDKPVTPKLALWFDGSWRRMELGSEPQQLLLRPGLQYTLAPGVRISAGYGYIATAPYGSLPSATPMREQRTWQQLLLTHRAGSATVSHRYRLEQRWIRPLLPSSGETDGALGPTTYQNRLRYLSRAQVNLGTLTYHTRPLLGIVWDELLMPLGGPAQALTVAQNRATIGVGIPVSRTQRVELAYLNLYNAFATRRANEINHTLWLSWHYTGLAPRQR